jgi:hypothetical protein
MKKRKRKELVGLLTEFIHWHYGDPSTGRHGHLGYAENLAALQAAATLKALLKDYEVRRSG